MLYPVGIMYPSLILRNIELHLLFESRRWWIRPIITYQSNYSSSPIDIFQSYSSIESLWYILLLSIVIFLMNFFFCVYKLDSIGAQINFEFYPFGNFSSIWLYKLAELSHNVVYFIISLLQYFNNFCQKSYLLTDWYLIVFPT